MASRPVSTNLLTSQFRGDDVANSENDHFRKRNHVSSSYRGPVFVVEDTYVCCALCMAPVNPVERVPVGTSFFHPQCLRCQICGKGNRTTAFHPVNNVPVCNTCHQRGMDSDTKRVRQLEDHPMWHLSNGTRLDPRNTTHRQAALIERQAALNFGDQNIKLLIQQETPRRRTSMSRGAQSTGTLNRRSSAVRPLALPPLPAQYMSPSPSRAL